MPSCISTKPRAAGGDDRPIAAQDTHQRLARAHLPQRGACPVPEEVADHCGGDQLPPRTRRSHAQDPGTNQVRVIRVMLTGSHDAMKAHPGRRGGLPVVCRQPRLAARDLRNGECRLPSYIATNRPRISAAVVPIVTGERRRPAPSHPKHRASDTTVRKSAHGPPLRRRRHVARPAQAISGHLCRSI